MKFFKNGAVIAYFWRRSSAVRRSAQNIHSLDVKNDEEFIRAENPPNAHKNPPFFRAADVIFQYTSDGCFPGLQLFGDYAFMRGVSRNTVYCVGYSDVDIHGALAQRCGELCEQLAVVAAYVFRGKFIQGDGFHILEASGAFAAVFA